MPAPRRNAEPGTVDESTAVVGNVNADRLIHDLNATQDLVLAQEEMIQKLAEQVEELRHAQSGEPDPVSPAEYEPAPLPEGAKRYSSRMTELTLMRVGTGHEMHGGVAVPVPVLTGKPIEFTGGVYTTSDEGEIEFIESQPGYGIDFHEDPTAVARHSSVEVRDGLRATEQSPRVPLTAPMGQAPKG